MAPVKHHQWRAELCSRTGPDLRPTSTPLCFPRYAEMTGLGVARYSEVEDAIVLVDDVGGSDP